MELVCVTTPQSEADATYRRLGTELPEQAHSGFVEYSVCGLGGLVLTVLLSFLFYAQLVAVAESFELLSSTLVVFVILSVWVLLWVVFGTLWEWRAGRYSPGR